MIKVFIFISKKKTKAFSWFVWFIFKAKSKWEKINSNFYVHCFMFDDDITCRVCGYYIFRFSNVKVNKRYRLYGTTNYLLCYQINWQLQYSTHSTYYRMNIWLLWKKEIMLKIHNFPISKLNWFIYAHFVFVFLLLIRLNV